MVGYKPNSEVKRHDMDYVVAGAVSGFITRTLFQPLDVLKIRFQLQIEPIKSQSGSKYRSLAQAASTIFKEEGVLAFWKGTAPAQLLSVTYGALQFLSFEILTEQAFHLLSENIFDKTKPFVHFTCGAMAGCIATTGSFPFDVIRTRLVAQGEPKLYRSMFGATRSMLRHEGLASFYKGLVPTLIQIMPNTGAQFAAYKIFQEIWSRANQTTQTGVLQNSTCGAAAGIVAKTLVYPLDLAKKRIQIQGFEQARQGFGGIRHYLNLSHLFRTIFKEEGISGLYKGLWPSVLKAALSTGSHFMFYEEALKFMKNFHT